MWICIYIYIHTLTVERLRTPLSSGRHCAKSSLPGYFILHFFHALSPLNTALLHVLYSHIKYGTICYFSTYIHNHHRRWPTECRGFSLLLCALQNVETSWKKKSKSKRTNSTVLVGLYSMGLVVYDRFCC